MPYKKLGLKCGIEIHQQLEGKKLFCNCPTMIREDKPDFIIKRKLRASAGESGEIDIAALQEQLRNRNFIYEGYHDTTCLVETDSEPPHEINQVALYTCLQLCKAVNASISPVIQVMRKIVIDGSNTSGFQRTALVGRNGQIETTAGKVRIDNISLEEDACKIIADSENEKIYRLDRLGIPLIEIGSAPDLKTPEQCQEAAKKIGLLLRSLPWIKRGLGTIRQDVNISIKEGSRIEIKGAQDLRQIPVLVELEVKRQAELLKIKAELRGVRLDPLKIIDLSSLLKNYPSLMIQKALGNGEKVLGITLNSFAGFVGRELQPNYRLGTEFSGRAKIKAGIGGIFHSDELPKDGINDVARIRKKMQCKAEDAFVLVIAKEKKAKIALHAVYERALEVLAGVPKEVRKANQDGTTTYLRPMPGAARMYPETDVPLIKPNLKKIKLPELLEEKIKRFQRDLNLGGDLAEFIAKSSRRELFEEIVSEHKDIKPAFIAETLTSTLLEIKRKYSLNSDKLNDDDFRELFRLLSENKIHKDIILDVLIDMIKDQFDIKRYTSLSTEEIHKVIKEIIAENEGAPFPALMGLCMKKLAGKAAGKFISEQLHHIIKKGHL